ncbi:MAG: ABC transporter permease [Thermoplasmata archaeon]|nr:ABC transporter permease [Thermoplasmata archaeon]
MASGVFNIMKKEVKEMVRDPRLLLGMIIVPLLMFPVMGGVMTASMETIEESASVIDLGIVNMDNGNRSHELVSFLVGRGVNETYYTYDDAWTAMNDTSTSCSVFLFIMPGFTETINNNGSALVVLYTPLQTYSITEGIPSEMVQNYVAGYRQSIVDERFLEAYPGQDVEALENPVYFPSYSVIDGEAHAIHPSSVTSQMMGQSIMIPVILMMLLIMGAQLAATSVAMEKEEKTLETLLTTPVSRASILFGKISGVVAISAIAIVAYGLGFGYYMSSMGALTEGSAVNLAELGLIPTTTGMVILMVTLFLSLVAALSLAVLVASFTEDVRSAQALMGIIYAPIFLPAIILMMVDISQLPSALQTLVYAIPFSYPVLAAKALYTNQFTMIFVGIIYQIIFTAVTIYLASRLFSSEKILTASFKLNKDKKGKSGFPIINALRRR